MADAQQAGGSGDFMSKFLPGLVLGLVIGLGVGAFGLPFITDRPPAVEPAVVGAPPADPAPRDYPDAPPADDPFAGMTPEQVQEALSAWKAEHGTPDPAAPSLPDAPIETPE